MTRPRWTQRIALTFIAILLLTAPTMAGSNEDRERPPTAKGEDERTVGWILIPTAEAARNFMPIQGRGLAYDVIDVNEGATFALQSTDPSRIAMCTGTVCFQSGDFDITFFHVREDGSTQVTGRYTDVGPVGGNVPPESDIAFVYLKTPGVTASLRGFQFEYVESA